MLKHRLHLTTRVFLLSAFLSCITGILCSCLSNHWITPDNVDCRIFDPEPAENQTLTWDGPCKGRYADGYGTLTVYQDSLLFIKCEGFFSKGRMQDFVKVTLYKNNHMVSQYEEEWYRGYPLNRIRNLTLIDTLDSAQNAREYLFLLKKYTLDHPDAWLDNFHKVLDQRIVFACDDILVKSKKGDPAAKVFKDELLLRVHNSDNSDFTYYTVYNHRIASLKDLLSDRFQPGGKQFYTDQAFDICDDKTIPSALPYTYAPVNPSAQSGLIFLKEKDFGNKHWYPVKRY